MCIYTVKIKTTKRLYRDILYINCFSFIIKKKKKKHYVNNKF